VTAERDPVELEMDVFGCGMERSDPCAGRNGKTRARGIAEKCAP
jgi:hypothetical protein